jgi:hypothetical protein
MVRDVVPDTFHCTGCGFFASQLPVSINGVERIDEDVRDGHSKP